MSNMQNRIIQQDVDPFTMVPNEIITEPTLSCSAKVIWMYLRMRPVDWKFYNTEIVKHFKMGEEKLLKCFKELESFGLISRTQIREKNGRWGTYNFQIFRTINHQTLDNTESPPEGEKPGPVKPAPVNQGLQRKKETKKDITNISRQPTKKFNPNNKLPTLDEIKEECEREKYFIDEEKFFKWCQKEGVLNSSWRSVLMRWSENPINKINPATLSKKPSLQSRLPLIYSCLENCFEIRNGGHNIKDWPKSSFKIEDGDFVFYYPNKRFLNVYRVTIEKLSSQYNIKFKPKTS